MNKKMTFGLAALAMVMAIAAVILAIPPAEADLVTACLLWFSENGKEAVENIWGNDPLYAADAGDVGCVQAMVDCRNAGLSVLWIDQSYWDNC